MKCAVKKLIQAREHDLGEVVVRRVLPGMSQRAVGPFVFFDHIGPVEFKGIGMNVRPHPHIGLVAITYLFDGEILHRDNTGVEQIIKPEEVNWMIAGSGIVHAERTPEHLKNQTWSLHGIQSWLALPTMHEKTAPQFLHYSASSLPVLRSPGCIVRVIAGQLHGLCAPVPVFTQTLYAEIVLEVNQIFNLQLKCEECAIYLIAGLIQVENTMISPHTLALLEFTDSVPITAKAKAHFLLIGGDKIEGKRHLWWNFVASEPEIIDDAKKRWSAMDYPPIAGETEFIPLPNC